MTGEIPEEDHVVRYASPRLVLEDGSVSGSAFVLRPDDSGLSVNWLERFGGSKEEQLSEVRKRIRMKLRRNGRFAELNVGSTREFVDEHATIQFVHDPLMSEGVHPDDPSHTEVRGLPSPDGERASLVGDLIAECVIGCYPGQRSE